MGAEVWVDDAGVVRAGRYVVGVVGGCGGAVRVGGCEGRCEGGEVVFVVGLIGVCLALSFSLFSSL